jgi:hypothetical protein
MSTYNVIIFTTRQTAFPSVTAHTTVSSLFSAVRPALFRAKASEDSWKKRCYNHERYDLDLHLENPELKGCVGEGGWVQTP